MSQKTIHIFLEKKIKMLLFIKKFSPCDSRSWSYTPFNTTYCSRLNHAINTGSSCLVTGWTLKVGKHTRQCSSPLYISVESINCYFQNITHANVRVYQCPGQGWHANPPSAAPASNMGFGSSLGCSTSIQLPVKRWGEQQRTAQGFRNHVGDQEAAPGSQTSCDYCSHLKTEPTNEDLSPSLCNGLLSKIHKLF